MKNLFFTISINFIFYFNLYAVCPNLGQLIARMEDAAPGTPIYANDFNGNRIEGTIDQVLIDQTNYRSYFVIRKFDGTISSHWIKDINPSTFESTIDFVRPNQYITFQSKSGKFYEGQIIGRETIVAETHLGPEDFVIIKDKFGKKEHFRVARIKEHSIRVKWSPVNNAKFFTQNGELKNIEVDMFVSFARQSDGNKIASRIKRIQVEPASQEISVTVEIFEADGSSFSKILSKSEMDTLKYSSKTEAWYNQLNSITPIPKPLFKTSGYSRSISFNSVRGKSSHINTHEITSNSGRQMANSNKIGDVVNHNNYRSYAEKKGLILDGENATPRNLEPGVKYTYIIRDDGTMAFGKVENTWEVGVKHMNLAQNDSVVAAGEVVRNADGTFAFNLDSGTFMRPLGKRSGLQSRDFNLERSKVVKNVFNAEINDPTKINYVEYGLFDDLPNPTKSQVDDYCRQLREFRYLNGSSAGNIWCP